MWDVDAAKGIAADRLSGLERRWAHVRSVGAVAEALAADHVGVPTVVVVAAWLHDLGYAPTLAHTGFHPVDGALFLQSMGAPAEVIGLVAHHTGATFEAEERDQVEALAALPCPSAGNLDLLTLIDLVVGPAGDLMTPSGRLDEVSSRYAVQDPVHRAITRSRPSLLASAARARLRLGLSDEWPLSATEGMLEA